jgi:hypothetical protein
MVIVKGWECVNCSIAGRFNANNHFIVYALGEANTTRNGGSTVRHLLELLHQL